jgi:hypothetical protein
MPVHTCPFAIYAAHRLEIPVDFTASRFYYGAAAWRFS